MTTPASLDRIARLVSGREDVTATPEERAIAKKTRSIGERMEREGYLPSLRRDRMMRVMMDEANQLGGAVVPLCACGSAQVEAKGDETRCAKCGKAWDGLEATS